MQPAVAMVPSSTKIYSHQGVCSESVYISGMAYTRILSKPRLAAPVTVVMVMVPMVAAPMVAALPTDEEQSNHQQPHPVFHRRCEERHRLLSQQAAALPCPQ